MTTGTKMRGGEVVSLSLTGHNEGMTEYTIQQDTDNYYALMCDGILIIAFPARWQLLEYISQSEFTGDTYIFDETVGQAL